jgi:hypothetical protein
MADAASSVPFPFPFHAHLVVVAQSRRTLLRQITPKRIRRGVFMSVTDLEVAIHLAQHNDHPRPFVWRAKAADKLAKVSRMKQSFESRSYPIPGFPGRAKARVEKALPLRVKPSRIATGHLQLGGTPIRSSTSPSGALRLFLGRLFQTSKTHPQRVFPIEYPCPIG